MKPFSLILMLLFSLCASLCCPDEEDFNAITQYVNNDEIISIENNLTLFNVGDIIFIETEINNQQVTTDGLDILLSDCTYSEIGQSQAFYQLKLYKETAFNTVVEIPLNSESIEIIEGDVRLNNTLIEVISLYDGNNFKSKFGIRLLESGTFYISGPRLLFNDNDGKTNLQIGVFERGYVDICSKIINSDTEGKYVFTVN